VTDAFVQEKHSFTKARSAVPDPMGDPVAFFLRLRKHATPQFALHISYGSRHPLRHRRGTQRGGKIFIQNDLLACRGY